jgi:hypothetical protein
VPFVDDHQRKRREQVAAVGAGEQQRQALRRGDQHFRQPPALPRALGGVGVAGAHAHLPVEAQVGERGGQRAGGIGGQRAHRRDPQAAQAAAARFAGEAAVEHPEVDGVGLAGAGGRVQQPRAARLDVGPDLALERKRHEAVGRKPRFGAGQRQLPRRGRAPARLRRCRLDGQRLLRRFARLPQPPRPQLRADVRSGRQAAHRREFQCADGTERRGP